MSGPFVTFSTAPRPGDVVHVGDVQGEGKNLGIVSVTVTTPEQDQELLARVTPAVKP